MIYQKTDQDGPEIKDLTVGQQSLHILIGLCQLMSRHIK